MNFRRSILSFSIALILGLTSGCTTPAAKSGIAQGSSGSSIPGLTVTPTQPANSTPENLSGPKLAVINAIRAQLDAKSFRLNSTIKSGDQSMDNIVEYEKPDRFHIISKNYEVIAIGQKTYTLENNRWIEVPINLAKIISNVTSFTMLQTISNNIYNVQLIGNEILNGKQETVYQFDSQVKLDSAILNLVTKIWIDQSTGLPDKEEILSDLQGVKADTINVIEYDPNIKIEPPIINKP
jgi:hypothetical protein